MNKKKIIVLGFMGACPIAGVIWQHLHYIIGLQRLGYEVFYVEDTFYIPYDSAGKRTSLNLSYTAKILKKLAQDYGFQNHWAYCERHELESTPNHEIIGMSYAALLQLYKDADCALNICGSHWINKDMETIRHIIYVESDPGVEQIKVDLGNQETISYLAKQHHLFTFGENIGSPDFPVPIYNQTWLPTRQPVVTDLWCNQAQGLTLPPTALYTSICNWSTSGKKDITWRGSQYLWSKSLEFLRFIEAPKKCGETFELASEITNSAQQELFIQNQWNLVSPLDLSADWDGYRKYIQNSKGEFTCAKDQYVRLKTGWFSDRSACYLAAGRPVITQETGFSKFYGGKYGLIGFSSMEEIVEAARSIRADYTKHSHAALEIAREFFEAEKVLRSLLDRAGV